MRREAGEARAGGAPAVTAGEIVAIAFLALMVVLILWNIRGHRRSGDTTDSWGTGGAGSDGAAD